MSLTELIFDREPGEHMPNLSSMTLFCRRVTKSLTGHTIFCQSKTRWDKRKCYTSRVDNKAASKLPSAWRKHERRWKNNRFVYAVISRRSRGVSIGINLNPGKECNFNCVYCQVDRRLPPTLRTVDAEKLEEELHGVLEAERDGSLYEDDPFNLLSPDGRGVRDIAFSGDGEPTASPIFAEAVHITARARRRLGLESTQLVLITNATCLNKPAVQAALKILDQNNGEIWAKLDAGSEAYFQRINRPSVSLEQILKNILGAARIRPIVIQSLWFRCDGVAPPLEEVEAYCRRLNDILASGARLKKLQLYTIARDPAEAFVSALSNDELDQIASTVKSSVPVPVEIF
jgi:wyosine [tRNA(Phe)-imidazoG37] synthetase (radical SAM superfamily)